MPSRFGDLAKFTNCILVGPRGIGKTTILKALTPTGLHYLSKRFDLSKFGIDYVPLYVPAETVWKGNVEAIRKLDISKELRAHILNGIFVNHCLHEIISSLEDSKDIAQLYTLHEIPAWATSVTESQEEKIARLLSDAWQLDKIQTSFIGIKLCLIRRSNEFCAAINSVMPTQARERATHIGHLDLLHMLRGFLDIAQNVLGKQKWSIHFDEMEIAPKELVLSLYLNLRSFDQRLSLKLSMFPFVDFLETIAKTEAQSTGPDPANDYVSISLSKSFTNVADRFSDRLVEQVCKSREVTVEQLAQYLNSSENIKQASKLGNSKRLRRNHEGIIDDIVAARIDPSAIRYFSKLGISSGQDIKDWTENKRAPFVRKPVPIAEIRNYYLREPIEKARGIERRSVKSFGYYHGFEQILLLTEGNPRSIFFYMNELIDAYKAGENSAKAQNTIIRRNVDRFRAFIATQAVPHDSIASPTKNTLNVVDLLGLSVSEEVLSETFNPEPLLSFEFVRLDKHNQNVIGIAINTGGLVAEQSSGASHLLYEVLKTRLRVSHRLAPFYPLPTITGKSKKLDRLPSPRVDLSSQPDLMSFGYEE